MSINILNAAKEFYALSALQIEINTGGKFEPFRPSHEKLKNEINEFMKEFTNHLARAIFDYTVLVVGGELRHCAKQCEVFNPNFPQGGDRNASYNLIKRFNPQQILRQGVFFFGQYWSSGFGGKSWEYIAKSGLMYEKINNFVFVDHMVDLSHNNSIYFDKGAGIIKMDNYYETYLNIKKFGSQEEVISLGVGEQFRNFFKRAKTLGLINKSFFISMVDFSATEMEVMNYQPVNWGYQKLDEEISRGHRYWEARIRDNRRRDEE